MKLIHTSDLHLGKRLNEYSLLDDQEYILNQIVNIARGEKADGILIAGDVYDKSQPSAEAMKLFDDFLVELSKLNVKTFIISGNHDSASRLAFGNRLLNREGIHISSVFGGTIEKIKFEDVNIWMLPFVKPLNVMQYYEDIERDDYTTAIARILSDVDIDENEINILIAHQFVAGAKASDSEESVGGLESVDSHIFSKFNYVALGHLHRPQRAGGNGRYSGSPLKYSFSEKDDIKSLCMIEIEDRNVEVTQIPLKGKREMMQLRGSFAEIVDEGKRNSYKYEDNYLRIILTDDDVIPDAIQILRGIFDRIMVLEYDNKRTGSTDMETAGAQKIESPIEVFEEFYEKMQGVAMSEEQVAFTNELIERIRGEK